MDHKLNVWCIRKAVAATAAAAALTMAFAITGCAAHDKAVLDTGEAPAANAVTAHEQSGIRILSVRWSAEGYFIDVRYEITDKEKASKWLTKDLKPLLKHDKSGKVLTVPNMAKVGKMQQTTNPPELGRVYFMMFGNDGMLPKGEKVTLILGDVSFEGLTVE